MFGFGSVRVLSIFFVLILIGITVMSPVSASTVECYAYEVVIEGYASGNEFVRSGLFVYYPITVTDITENGVNDFEFALVSGNPGISPEVGAIVFASNTAVLGRRAALDMVYMQQEYDDEYDLSYWHVNPDPDLASTTNNYFNTSSGLTGSLYHIYGTAETYFNFAFSEDGSEFSAVIGVLGGSMYYHEVPYEAQITGTFAGTFYDEDCILNNV